MEIAQQETQGIFHGGFSHLEIVVKLLNGSALGVAVGNKPIVIIQVAQFLEHIDIPDKTEYCGLHQDRYVPIRCLLALAQASTSGGSPAA